MKGIADTGFMVAACNFCNGADNRYFDFALGRGISFEGLDRGKLVAQRKRFVEVTRNAYEEFWKGNVESP